MHNNIGYSPLSGKITFVGKNLAEIIDMFGKYLYSLNGEKLNYSEMGERLSHKKYTI